MKIELLNKIQLINADCMDVLRELPDNGRKGGGVAIRSKYRDNTKQSIRDLLRP